MHLEVLVEDASGKIALEAFLEKILGPNGNPHTYVIHPYKGIGRIPRGMRPNDDPSKRFLLNQLPRILRGYGKTFNGYDQNYQAVVVVVVDLDDRNCGDFKGELLGVLNACNPRPDTLFRIAIEESEAWLMGDRNAVKVAYSTAKDQVLDGYGQDSICGTWEILADAIYPGGADKLKNEGWPKNGQMKCEWAEKIAPHVNIETNASKSFQVFRDGVRRLTNIAV